MNPTEVKELVSKKVLMARVLWLALMSSIGMYLIIGFLLPRMGGLPEQTSPQPEMLKPILMGAGVLFALIGVMIGAGKLPLMKIEGGEPEEVVGKVFSIMVISWAVCESAGIVGLVIFMLVRSFQDLLIMCGVAAVGMIFTFPTEAKFTAAVGGIEEYGPTMPPQ